MDEKEQKEQKVEEALKKETINEETPDKKPAGGGKTCWWIGIIIVVVIVVAYFGLAWLLRTMDKTQEEPSTETTSTTPTSSSSTANTGESQSVKDLVGTWETTCLTPDINSDWSEKHVFTFNNDGTAKHVRSSGENCSSLQEDPAQNYEVSIPAEGQINFIATDGGGSIYDIYEFSDDGLLRFGHGFCNCSSTGGKTGSSESDRFTQLNNYLSYQEK